MEGKVRCADPGCQNLFLASLEKCDRCSFSKEKSLQYFSNRKGGGFRGRGSYSDRGGFRRPQTSRPKYVDQNVDMSNAVIASFVEFAKFLDARHDKHERIVKLSRDITIESKRAIFLLHRIQGDDNEPEVLNEAKKKLDDIRFKFWFYVGKELQNGGDPYLFQRAYTAGLQEYIEALSFYQYIKEGRLITWKEVQDNLTFTSSKRRESTRHESQKDEADQTEAAQPVNPTGPAQSSDPAEAQAKPVETATERQPDEDVAEVESGINKDKTETSSIASATIKEQSSTIVLVPKMDFLLGIADLTGEMMRKAITSAAAGNTSTCFAIFADLQDIYSSFLSLNREGQREMSRKIQVLESSLKKVENVCYNINVRSTEIPKHMIGTYMALREATSKDDNRKPEETEDPSFD